MTTPKPITPEDLRKMISDALDKRGKSADYVAGYLAAQDLSGWTRANCPGWIRRSAALHFTLTPADDPRNSEPTPRTQENQKS